MNPTPTPNPEAGNRLEGRFLECWIYIIKVCMYVGAMYAFVLLGWAGRVAWRDVY